MKDLGLLLAERKDTSSRKRPLRHLSSLVNTFELSAVKTRITNPFGRGCPLDDDLADTSMETNDTIDDINDTIQDIQDVHVADMNHIHDTSEDSDGGLPTRPRRAVEPVIRRTQSLYTSHLELRGNGRLDKSAIRTFKVMNDLLPRIDDAELARILAGEHADEFDDYIVVDCRFPYEYDGGHISTAINVPLHSELEKIFMENAAHLRRGRSRLLIFHCEYSVFRGPTMASHLRKVDRVYNADNYPELLYPDIVVLDGGYKRFFDAHRHLCHPQAYIEMRDLSHRSACESLMNKVLQVSKLTRAKLFNQFQPRTLSLHTRSSSYTVCSSDPLTSPVSLRRKRSAMIHKRDRRDRLLLTRADSPRLVLTRADSLPAGALAFLDDDLAPPPALFRNPSKRLLLLLISVSSLLLLVCSDLDSSAFLSSDSLHDSFSTPTAETSDVSNHSSPTRAYTFPCKPPPLVKPRLSRINSRATLNTHHLSLSSPTISSPLSTTTPTCPFDSTTPNSHSLIDSINETPFDFPLNIKSHHRERSRAFSCLSGNLPFASLDIDEVEEESD